MPIFVRNQENDPEDNSEYFQGVQSSEMSKICIMADARDNSKMYPKLFLNFYAYAESLQSHGNPASEYDPFLHPMKVSYPSDLKAILTTSGSLVEVGTIRKHLSFSIITLQYTMI
jgi:hypothetical protein